MSVQPPPVAEITSSALARGMLVVSLFAVVAGLARIGQDAAIAWRHGTEPIVDAYYFLNSMSGWPVAVALSTLTMLIAPAEAALRGSRPEFTTRLRAELLGCVLLLTLVALPLAYWAMYAATGTAWGGLAAAARADAQAGMWAMALAVPFGLLAALFAAWLVASARHVLTLLEALPPMVLAAALLLLPGPVLFWGTTAGIALQAIAMALVLHLSRSLPVPRLGLSAQAWRGFADGALLLLAGQMLFSLVPLVDPFFAARLGDGAVASLSYANRLVLGLQGLAGLALQRAGLPLLSHWMVTAPAQARRAALRWAWAAAAGGALLGLAVALLADPLVSLLYERGRFTASDRGEVAQLLRFGMLQMPIFLGGLVVVTALASASARHTLALVAAVGLAAKLLLSAWWVTYHGAVGLVMASAGMYVVTTLLAWLALRRLAAQGG